MSGPGHVLLVGPHGVTGGAIARRLAAASAWELTTASRQDPVEAGTGPQPAHVALDLLDRSRAEAALAGLPAVTHLIYAAYSERGSMEDTREVNVSMLTNALAALNAHHNSLRHVVLIGGGKSYGAHLGAYRTPAKESDPRILGPLFYNDQEDLLAEHARSRGISWTVLRPDVVIGPSIGSPMNLLLAIAVFATLSKDSGVPLRFPGSRQALDALHQFTDAALLAAAAEWSLTSVNAHNQVFNVINGDQFRWKHLWPEVATAFGMPLGDPLPMRLREQMADKGSQWSELAARHQLRPTPYERLVSWDFADGLWNSGFDMVQSTIKIRQAGFGDSVDSHQSLMHHLEQLRAQRYIP